MGLSIDAKLLVLADGSFMFDMVKCTFGEMRYIDGVV